MGIYLFPNVNKSSIICKQLTRRLPLVRHAHSTEFEICTVWFPNPIQPSSIKVRLFIAKFATKPSCSVSEILRFLPRHAHWKDHHVLISGEVGQRLFTLKSTDLHKGKSWILTNISFFVKINHLSNNPCPFYQLSFEILSHRAVRKDAGKIVFFPYGFNEWLAWRC